ncbi:hypothetical protein KM043_000178 [Ampulex compressa]|nr:hypothetical protein KM043_000178 [Ampulex compressa]
MEPYGPRSLGGKSRIARSLVLVIGLLIGTGLANDCIPRSFKADSIVCVCNATYCDGTPPIEPLKPEDRNFYHFVSSKDGLRFFFAKEKFEETCNFVTAPSTLALDARETFQRIHGFGGAFTDSTGINIKKLSHEAQKQLLRSYFCPESGSGYNLCRVPFGGTDFSTRPYTYDDIVNDVHLKYFNLSAEDYDYKIPLIKTAQEINKNVMFVASAWTAPAWMKTNNDCCSYGYLKHDMYQVWSDYYIKCFDEYRKHNISFWAVTTGNEPINVLAFDFPIPKMGWTETGMAEWVANNFGPTLHNSIHNHTYILALDDQRLELPWFMDRVFGNKRAKKYIAGTAVHWYWDLIISANVLDMMHEKYPEKLLIITEASTGSAPWEKEKVILGSWERGARYILNIIENLKHNMNGWIDWNLALDKRGGPNWNENFVDSAIIVNPDTDEFYKQPMYYAIKHFSRFVKRGSKRIKITDTQHVKSIAFSTPSKEIVIVLYNRNDVPENIIVDTVPLGVSISTDDDTDKNKTFPQTPWYIR